MVGAHAWLGGVLVPVVSIQPVSVRHLSFVCGSPLLARLILFLQRFDKGRYVVKPERPALSGIEYGQEAITGFRAPIWSAFIVQPWR